MMAETGGWDFRGQKIGTKSHEKLCLVQIRKCLVNFSYRLFM